MSPGPVPTEPGTSPVATRPVVLVGMPGAGKSTVGQALARRLGWDFVDLDAAVEAAAGVGIPELWRREGEEGFRRRETAALAEVMARSRGGAGTGAPAAVSTPSSGVAGVVVATGGGVVVVEENRRHLAGAVVVWLRARLETLAARVGSGDGRPLLAGGGGGGGGGGGDVAVDLAALARTREPLYESAADVVLDVDDCTVDHVVDLLDTALATRSA